MTYVLAYSIHGIYDVTRRYVKDYEVIVKRRKKEDERRLNKFIVDTTNSIRSNLAPELIEPLFLRDDLETNELFKIIKEKVI